MFEGVISFTHCNSARWREQCRFYVIFLSPKLPFSGLVCNNDDTGGNKTCPLRSCCVQWLWGWCTLSFFPPSPHVQLLYSRMPPLPLRITLYVLRISQSPEAEQAPPLATAARLVALSQVIWGKWATQRRWRDADGNGTIEAQIFPVVTPRYKSNTDCRCWFCSGLMAGWAVQHVFKKKRKSHKEKAQVSRRSRCVSVCASCSILPHSLVG